MKIFTTLQFGSHLLRWLWILTLIVAFYGLGKFWASVPKSTKVTATDPTAPIASENNADDGARNVIWEASNPGREGVNFDLFTPPVITLSEGKLGVFDRVDYFGPQINIKLIAIEKIPYRLQLEGFANLGGEHCRLFIRQLDNQKLHVGERGTHFPEAQFEIRQCQLQSRFSDGSRQNYPQVTLFDHLLNREVTLNSKEKIYSAEYRIHFEISEENRGVFKPIFHAIGEKIKVGSRDYELLKIDPSANSITLRQNNLDGTNVLIETYRLSESATN